MKRTRFIAAVMSVLTAIMFSQAAFAAQSFGDVPSEHWAIESITKMAEEGVLSGYTDNTFRPDNDVTRAEWAKMLALKGGFATDNDSVYFDDMQNHWANEYVNAVADCFEGNGGEFNPDSPALREDVAVSMVKAAGYDVSAADISYIDAFTDADDISDENAQYIALAVEIGLITGFEDSTFRPSATLTRAEAATLLYRAYGSAEASDASSPDTAAGTSSGASSSSSSSASSDDYTSNVINAVIELSNGDKINLELYPDLAPITVANFVSLAEEGKYDGTIFHRVIEGFMIQGGGYDLGFDAVDADNIIGEFSSNGYDNDLSHTRGVISMARAQDYDSASSQFFIMHQDALYLDGEYAAFGRVSDDESLAVVDKIAAVSTGVIEELGLSDVPVSPVLITTITIE